MLRYSSEYAEGSSNNKYLEIYNAGPEAVDLTEYAIPNVSNAPTVVGEYEYWNTFDAGATIAPGGVYIVAHPSADSSILALANQTLSFLSNGDDGYALVFGTELAYEVVDWIGDWNGDPGSGWSVAGVANATQDHVLVRKCGITTGNTDWTASAGTTAEDSEWNVLAMDTWDNLGSHQVTDCVVAVYGCTDEVACNYDAAATDDDLSCEYANVCGSCTGDLSCTVGVTVSVDMNIEGYNSANGPMTINLDGGAWADMNDDDGDNVWTYTFNVLPNTVHTYNFNDGWYESSANLGDCAGGTFGNDRSFTSADTNVVVSTVCWESCVACVYVPGCLDAAACNYNADANTDDGSCTYAAEGLDCDGNCLAGTAVVYTSGSYAYENQFTITDCDGIVLAEMTSGSTGFNSCVVLGDNYVIDLVDTYGDGWNGGSLSIGGVVYTIDDNAVNTDTYNEIVGSCGVPGCTDNTACNFNADATFDDGSCTFAGPGLDCDGNCLSGTGLTLTLYDSYDDGWDYWDGSVSYLTINGNNYGQDYLSGGPLAISICADLDACTEVVFTPANGWSSENSWDIVDADGNILASGGNYGDIFGTCVTGCTDAAAENYNPDADISDNTLCTYALVQGCTDATACNYDPAAEQDNGSCTYPAEGLDCDGNCLVGTLTTINVQEVSVNWGYTYSLVSWGGNWSLVDATTGSAVDGVGLNNTSTDDASLCLVDGCYEISGISGSGSSYAFAYTLNGGSLVTPGVGGAVGADFISIGEAGCITGCTDEVAENYNPDAHITDNTLCTYALVQGCTDVTACNYDPAAEQDNGSCTYPADGFDCDGNCLSGSQLTLTLSDSYGDGWDYFDGSVSFLTINGVTYGQNFLDGSTYTATVCSDLDVCNDVIFTPANGWSYENSWSIADADGNVLASGDNFGASYGTCNIGCTDPLANNFDPINVVEDGSCVYCIDGVEVSELPPATLPDDIVTITIETGSSYSSEISWELYNNETSEFIIASTQTYQNNTTYSKTTGCLPDGCYKLVTYDSYGDGWNGNGTFTVTNQFGEILIPSTAMGPNSGINTEQELNDGYGVPQELSSYFTLGDEASCPVFGCTDPLASNYDADATIDNGTCITCAEGEVDVTFSFNQEGITSDEVFVYNETDTVFSVVTGELGFWEGKTEMMCVPAGCYTIAMNSVSSAGWTDGSELQITADFTSDYFSLEDASIDLTVVSIGGGECIDTNVGGCTDPTYDNYNPDATFENGSCQYLCEFATEGATANVDEDAETAPWSYLCSDATGFGAVVTFEDLGADMTYVVADCDSAEVFTYTPNTVEVFLEAGQCVYFQAVDTWSTSGVGTITATLTELPDSAYWGCMDEFSCNYDETATYQPEDACIYPEIGYDCDGVILPDFYEVELDYAASFSLCLDDNDFSASNISDYPGYSWNTDGEDIGFTFVADGNSVLASVFGYADGSYNDGFLVIYNGNPLEGGTIVSSQSYSGTADMEFDIIFETDSGSSYYVIVDSDNFDCYAFDISINSLIGVGGCNDELACNFDPAADYNDLTCIYPIPGFDCDTNFVGTGCGYDNIISDSIIGPYSNNMYEVFVYPSDGITPVSIVFTAGESESNYDYWYVYDGIDENAISSENQIAVFDGDLTYSYATGLGNGITVVFQSDAFVTRPDDMVFDIYCSDLNVVGGCLDTLACNYNPDADFDDGTCFIPVEGFDCDGNFLASACGFDNIVSDSIVGPYSNNMYETFIYPSDGVTPVTVVFTAGETETNWDYWYVYDGIGDDAISLGNLIASFDGDLAYSYATGYGNGITVVFDSDGSVTRNDDMVFDVYCSAQDLVGGCIDSLACNFDSEADYDDGTCYYSTELLDCNGDCIVGETYTINLFDSYGDGWISIGGTHQLYVDGQTFTLLSGTEASFTTCLEDICHEIYFISGGVWESECSYSVSDADGNVVYSSNNSTTIDNPGLFGAACGTFGCTDPSATNYDATVDYDNGTCEYPIAMEVELDYTTSSSTCLHDNDYDATNTAYDALFTDYMSGEDMAYYFQGANGSVSASFAISSSTTYTSLAIFDGDPLDPNTSLVAFDWGYSSTSTGQSIIFETNDTTTYYVVVDGLLTWGCYDYDLTLLYTDGAFGCTDEAACNFDPLATTDDGSCTYPANEFVDCFGNCAFDEVTITLIESYGDGTLASISVNGEEVLSNPGTAFACVDLAQCNTVTYNSNGEYFTSEDSWTVSDASNVYVTSASYANNLDDPDTQEFGSCGQAGCMDSLACNFDPLAEVNFGCTYAEEGYDCDGVCLEDADADGICDGDEVAGCTDATATNYDASATDDDGSCIACEENSVELMMYDAFGDGWDGATFSMTDGSTTITSEGITEYSGFASEYLCVPAGCYEVTVGGGLTDYEVTFTLGNVLVDADAGTYSNVSIGGIGDVGYCDLVSVSFSVDMALASSEYSAEDYTNVVINGSWNGWNGWGVVLSDDDGDNVWTGSGVFDPSIGQFEYVVAVTGPADEYSGWGMQWGEGCVNNNFLVSFEDEAESYSESPTVGCLVVAGCTDPNADNFNPNANEDDGSCTYCGDFTAIILATSDATTFGGSDGYVQATGQGGSSNYDVNVFDADGVPQNPFALTAGNFVVAVTDITSNCISELEFTIGQPSGPDPCDVVPTGLYVDNIIHNRVTFNWAATESAPSHYMIRYRVLGSSSWTVITAGTINTNAFNGTSRTRYFMEPGTTYEWSIRARVLNEDLTINCQSDWSANAQYTTLPECANLENLSVSAEATWVTFFADAPSEDWGVWQSKGKIRAVGTNSYRYVIGDSEGNINGLKGNFTASTDYEWHTKAWCSGNEDENGNPDPMYHSGWGDFSAFSTEAPCDKMPMNLTTSSNAANTAVIMSWDTPESGAPDHYFLEMTNVTTGAVFEWNNIPGTDNSKTKFNQNPGDEISWRIRGACGPNGTSWATIFSQPVTYTLGGDRVAADLVSGLDVYPNPSRDIFNITFTSEEAQTMSVKVVNMIGEEIYNEELVDFVGQYTKVIDMNTQPKGVYFLEITTSTGGINKKIVLQ